jgi:hypothetical protein
MNIYSPRVKYIVSIFLMNSMISAAALITVFPSFLGAQDQTDFVAAVKLGDTVRWTNNDNTLHTVIEGDPETGQITGGFASDIVAPAGTFEYKFEKVGTFDYYCRLHPNMVGKVEVVS